MSFMPLQWVWVWRQDEKKSKAYRHFLPQQRHCVIGILMKHPEIEFVQLAVNCIDWDSEMVQAKDCYEVTRRHGKRQ